VGFGPAAIAVAAAFEDEYEYAPPDRQRVSATYLERAENSAWLPNLVLPGTDIQHHFLRDYASPRNPRSRFSFTNYLKDTGRFYPFTLMANYVTRQEWSEYTLWTVRQLDQNVRYHSEVLDISPCGDDRVTAAAVQYRDVRTGRIGETLARNVMISTGHVPYMPELFEPHAGERVFHSSGYLTKVEGFDRETPLRIAVIGAGQTAGEIFLHLAQSFPNAQLYSLARNSGIRLYELGHFSNEAYFPEETDYFYELDTERRRKVFGEQRATNYAAVDPDLSTAWYRAVYDDNNFGPGRLHMRKRTCVESVTPAAGGGVRLGLREVYRGIPDELDVDLVVLCTGYREPSMPSSLAPFAPFIPLDADGYPQVTKAHRVVTTPGCEVGIYLNGITEWRHGINSATSFSTLALKAGRIADDIEERYMASKAEHLTPVLDGKR
jgi:L-ornithine N5-oxygenase